MQLNIYCLLHEINLSMLQMADYLERFDVKNFVQTVCYQMIEFDYGIICIVRKTIFLAAQDYFDSIFSEASFLIVPD